MKNIHILATDNITKKKKQHITMGNILIGIIIIAVMLFISIALASANGKDEDEL